MNKINLLNENKLLVVPEGTFCPKCQNYFVANKEELEKDILVLTATENDVSFKKNIDINQYSQLFDKYYQPILFIVKNGKIVAHKSLDSNEFIRFCSNLLKNDN